VLELMASQDRYRNMISSLPVPLLQVDARPAGRIFDRLAGQRRSPTSTPICASIRSWSTSPATSSWSPTPTRRPWRCWAPATAPSLIAPVAYVFTGTPGSGRRVTIAHFLGLRNYVEDFKIRSFDGRLLDVTLMMTFPVPGERLDTTLITMVDNTARLRAEARLRRGRDRLPARRAPCRPWAS
jgi:two-component system sensor kinase FixL